MVDITHKSNTLRIAKAQAIVEVSRPETIAAIESKNIPKGDLFEISRAAGLLAVKQTANVIPDCHPIPIEYTGVSYQIDDLQITISIEVKTIYKTGVEVEAMHGASVIALTMYDMLKPIDKGVLVKEIKLIEKKGGKSQYRNQKGNHLKAAVIVCSDSISAGTKKDRAGLVIREKLEGFGVQVMDYTIIPDEAEEIEKMVFKAYDENFNLLIFTGGTGLSPRDVTPDVIRPLLDREIPGIAETARSYGQDRIPYAMLSRSIAGVKGETLILTLPGSTKGASESMDALFPHILHVFGILKGSRHEG